MPIKVYAGYYEYFITKSELKEPCMYQFEGDESEIEDFLAECDDYILVEKGLDFNHNATIVVKDGVPEVVEEEEN